MINATQAINFIRENGNAVDQARLAYISVRKRPSAKEHAIFATSQREDGGWSPFWAEDYSSVDATCFQLAKADQLGLGAETPFVDKALNFLADNQVPRGWIEEDSRVVDIAPPWAQPGNQAARLYLTANSAYWLAVHGFTVWDKIRASEYLLNSVSNGAVPSYLHTYWLACGLWQKMGQDAVVESVCGHLQSRIADLSANNLTWMLVALRTAGIPSTHPLIKGAIERLIQMQQEDGRWASDDEMEQDTHVTLEALRALQLCKFPF